jgi:chemotaxis protein MotB
MAARRRRHAGGHDEEGHENAERWLLTYADMITLLMVLFIVMFAMSTVDANKFAQLKESLAGAFGGSSTLVSGGASAGGDSDSTSPGDIDLSAEGGGSATMGGKSPTEAQKQAAQDKAAVLTADRAKASRNQQAAEDEADRLVKLRKQMVAALKAQKLSGQVMFSIDERGLVVRVLTSGVVFGGDSAVLRPEGQRILRALAPTLAAVPNHLEISGHTNQLNVPTRNYPSSWELSTARASSVVRYLLGLDLAANRMTAAGYADQRPLYPPSDPRAVTMNRRVEVVVLSDQPAEVRALLKAAAEGK